MSYNIAVVGATGNVGRTVLEILAERNFLVNKMYCIASEKSRGKKVSFGNETITVESLNRFDFSNVDLAFFSPGSKVSAEFAPKAAKHAVVIDKSSYFRLHKEIPLIIPEINSSALKGFEKNNIISNPNCAVLPLALVLKPLHDQAKIKRVVVTTFQSVSGAGKAAMDELYSQTKRKFMFGDVTTQIFPKQIAFNVLPHVGDFLPSGETQEELKIAQEFKKILNADIEVTATCVRIPVFIGHSLSVNIEFDQPMDAKAARSILKKSAGISVVDDIKNNAYITPIEAAGEDFVYVSRIRNDNSLKNGLNIWIVSDNLRKGAALNAVQIAEKLVEEYL